MTTYNVYFVSDAEDDLVEIYNYVSADDSAAKADTLLSNIEECCLSLLSFPNRGHIPPELERIGVLA